MLTNQGIDMRRYLNTALFMAMLGLTWATPAVAQGYRSAIGWNGGVLFPTSLNDGGGGGSVVDLKPDMTWIVSGHYDHWLSGGRLGGRARVGYSKPVVPWVQGDRAIRVFLLDLGLLLRPVAPIPNRSLLPFVAGGVGLVNWGFGSGPPTTYDPAGTTYGGDESFDLVASAGAGIDFITPWQWGEDPLVIRLEGRDHIQFSSPLESTGPDASDFGMIHHVAIVVGFHTAMGLFEGDR